MANKIQLTLKAVKPKKAVTITFGNRGENHIHQEQIGEDVESGMSVDELRESFKRCGGTMIELKSYIKDGDFTKFKKENSDISESEETLRELWRNTPEACVMIVEEGCKLLGVDKDEWYNEQNGLMVDSQFYNVKTGSVCNKLARHNLCFDTVGHPPDYENRRGRVYAFEDVPLTRRVRESLPEVLGEKARNLIAEGNYYYEPSKTGIGYHGDGERKIVVAFRLGVEIPLHYQWYIRGKPFGDNIKLTIKPGSMYVMSELAVGTNWKRQKIFTLRHAAGCEKYTKIVKK